MLSDKDGPKSIVLTGDYGSGKTSILSKLAILLQPRTQTESTLTYTKGKEKTYKIFMNFCRNVRGGASTEEMMIRISNEVFGIETVWAIIRSLEKALWFLFFFSSMEVQT